MTTRQKNHRPPDGYLMADDPNTGLVAPLGFWLPAGRDLAALGLEAFCEISAADVANKGVRVEKMGALVRRKQARQNR